MPPLVVLVSLWKPTATHIVVDEHEIAFTEVATDCAFHVVPLSVVARTEDPLAAKQFEADGQEIE
jgi:hypothetical protein